jgi:hypothetical protein
MLLAGKRVLVARTAHATMKIGATGAKVLARFQSASAYAQGDLLIFD